jgi:hypothetical protein
MSLPSFAIGEVDEAATVDIDALALRDRAASGRPQMFNLAIESD